MKAKFLLLFCVFLILFSGINYYVGCRLWQVFFSYHSFINNIVYWLIFGFISFSYLLARLLQRYYPSSLDKLLIYIGSYWLGFMFYFVLAFVFFDLVKLLNSNVKIIPQYIFGNPYTGFWIMATVVTIIVYGSWNATNTHVKNYQINIDKYANEITELNVVMVSDIHLGPIIGTTALTAMVTKINDLNPDIVILAGDTIDEDVNLFAKQKMADILIKLKPKFRTYAVLGNHEHIGGNQDTAVRYLSEAGIHVLRDAYEMISNSLYIIGREDQSAKRFGGHQRKDLVELAHGINSALPIIVIDHQPVNIDQAIAARVDLQVSGHTHRGQLFPNNFITQKIFKTDWGILNYRDFNLIVSSGFGTWGPPIRTGSFSEIVSINLKFKDSHYNNWSKSVIQDSM